MLIPPLQRAGCTHYGEASSGGSFRSSIGRGVCVAGTAASGSAAEPPKTGGSPAVLAAGGRDASVDLTREQILVSTCICPAHIQIHATLRPLSARLAYSQGQACDCFRLASMPETGLPIGPTGMACGSRD